ncbi:ferredoxin-type protein NapG [Campylobacter mucosalis]|uniref:ferredoxin-type protein NapG n=1 Tax=Campylobacter mucosalis TaxID=202 RepID=UPI0014701F52
MRDLNQKSRREALKFGVKALALVVAGGFVWSKAVKAENLVLLRPPGAKGEKDFLASCIRCGLCVEACPFDTLKLASTTDGISVGTPFFTPRDIPCRLCEDIPCTVACPTNALDRALVSDSDGKLDVNRSKMGVAIVDSSSCIAFLGIRCDACYRECPLIDKALKLEYRRNERTQKHAYLLPVVDLNVCTGCGICEHVCVTQKPAITIVPTSVVIGSVDKNYIKGWIEGDDKRLDGIDTNIKLEHKKVLDYLNEGEL